VGCRLIKSFIDTASKKEYNAIDRIGKAMKERVVAVKQTEKGAFCWKPLCESAMKTTPELLRRKQSKCSRMPALKDKT